MGDKCKGCYLGPKDMYCCIEKANEIDICPCLLCIVKVICKDNSRYKCSLRVDVIHSIYKIQTLQFMGASGREKLINNLNEHLRERSKNDRPYDPKKVSMLKAMLMGEELGDK